MTVFDYHDGVLSADGVSLAAIADAVGTPVYCYAQRAIEARYRSFEAALDDPDATICYAVKANSNLAVIRALADLGAGADVVSEGELRRALTAGVSPSRIVYSGVGKTVDEMAFALTSGIRQINVESMPELELLNDVAERLGRRAEIAIRVNPDVDAGTHEKITTGRRENKFGIDLAHIETAADRAAALPALNLIGLAVHIGSQLTDLAPFERAFTKLAEVTRMLRDVGHDIRHLDLGGGLGIDYGDRKRVDFAAYADVVRRTVGDLGCRLAFEPGRALVGDAGALVTRVLFMKTGETRTFAIVDAAMNDLVRPAMYGAEHDIVSIAEPKSGATEAVDIVGPVCETGDRLGLGQPLPPLKDGDLLAIRAAGAYGAVMSSTYNSRPLVPEVMICDGRFAVVRPRQSYDAMLAQDRLPDWQNEASDTVRRATA